MSTVIVQDDGTQVEIKPEFADAARAAGHNVVDSAEGADAPDPHATLRASLYGAGAVGAVGAAGYGAVKGVKALGKGATGRMAKQGAKEFANHVAGPAIRILKAGAASPTGVEPGGPSLKPTLPFEPEPAPTPPPPAPEPASPAPAPEGKVVGGIAPRVKLGQKATPKQRGVTQRVLDQRAKGLEEVRARTPVAAGEPDLGAQLEKSLALERLMTERGVPQAERAALRQGVRLAEAGSLGPALKGVAGLGGPALELMLMILSSSDVPQQMDEARRIVESSRPAAEQTLHRHLLAGAPTPI